METEQNDAISIGEIFKILLKKWWIIVASAIVCAFIAFIFSYAFTTQTYKATSKLYVNNQSLTIGATKQTITSSDITANRSLTESYAIILTSRTTLEKVLAEVELEDENGNIVKGNKIYSYAEFYKMITVGAVSDTEILGVSVVCANKDHAKALANAILEVFPTEVERIIAGSSTNVVDYAANATPVSRKISTKTIIGFLIGVIISCAIILVVYIFIDDTIESSEWIKKTYGESLPVLAIVPNSSSHSLTNGHRSYAYYANTPENK